MPRLPVLVLAVLAAVPLRAQEILRPLAGNAALRAAAAARPSAEGQRSGGRRDTLCLPFFDDFSNPRFRLTAEGGACDDTAHRRNPAIYPTDLLWADENAFVNGTYPIDPPTYGVATLDGLKGNGRPYSETSDFGPADTLTSKPIRLGGPLADSVFLSFYFQPGGRGDSPEPLDSLLLEFLDDAGNWTWVWGAAHENGAAPDPFRLAMVKVGEPRWWHDGFRFRFRNKASRNGNNDHWHLDYVLLDEDRDRGDTLFRDVAFAGPPPGMLRRYRSLPWRQFRDHQAEALAPGMVAQVFNNFTAANNTNFRDSLIVTADGSLVGTSPSESAAVPARGFTTFNHANYPIPETAPGYGEDSFSVTWRLRLRPSDDISPWNDTLLVRQDFRNFFAYDDGTAERAYGLIGTGAKLAQRYETYAPDTLYAVYIHWAFVTGGVGDKFFSLIVFDDIDTTGTTDFDSVLYQEDFLVPRYPDSLNAWFVYRLDEPVPVDGIFYIGWLQSQEDLLNVGFDRNTDASGELFFNLGDAWLRSALPGTVMMRPQAGPDYRSYPFVSGLPASPAAAEPFAVWPNPATDAVRWTPSAEGRVDLLDLSGRVLHSAPVARGRLATAGLPAGLYLLRQSAPGAAPRTARLAVAPR